MVQLLFGWFGFGLLRSLSWRPIAELLLLWLAGGMFTFYTFVTHGNWQIGRPAA
jgi:hypothetical protein